MLTQFEMKYGLSAWRLEVIAPEVFNYNYDTKNI